MTARVDGVHYQHIVARRTHEQRKGYQDTEDAVQHVSLTQHAKTTKACIALDAILIARWIGHRGKSFQTKLRSYKIEMKYHKSTLGWIE